MSKKVALITGASSGIGATTSVHFSRLGYKLSLTGRDRERLEDVRNKCLAEGLDASDVLATVADLTSMEQIEMLVEKTITTFGQLDVLVNNAGCLAGYKTIQTTTDDEFNNLLDVNLRAPVRLAKLVIPYLVKSKGNIINVSSAAGQIVIPAIHMYGVCKAGLDHFTRGLAVEMAKNGVRVNSISPGAIVTPVFERNGLSLQDAQTIFSQKIPMGRLGTTTEVAKAIAFLADDNTGSYITGAVWNVDGAISSSF